MNTTTAVDKEILIQRFVQNEFHELLFEKRGFKDKSYFSTECPNPDFQLKVGQLVTFTNEYGVSFVNQKILGFDTQPCNQRAVFLSSSSYWFPVEPESLTIQDGYIGITENDIAAITEEYRDRFYPTYEMSLLK